MDEHPRRGWNELHLLGNLPADLDKGLAIVGTDLLFIGQIVEDLLARHPRGQTAATTPRSGMAGHFRRSLFSHVVVYELLCFVEQAELIAMDPLAARPEALALEQSDILEKLLDLEVAFLNRGISLNDERLQALDIVRKCHALTHDYKLT